MDLRLLESQVMGNSRSKAYTWDQICHLDAVSNICRSVYHGHRLPYPYPMWQVYHDDANHPVATSFDCVTVAAVDLVVVAAVADAAVHDELVFVDDLGPVNSDDASLPYSRHKLSPD